MKKFKTQIRKILLPTVKDQRGNLGYIENSRQIPFDIKRVFYVYDIPHGAERGAHAHRSLQQVLKLKIDEVVYTKNIIPITHLFFSFTKTIYVLDLAFKYPAIKAYKKLDTFYMNVFLGLSLKFAKQVLAISQFTKDEIIKFYPRINRNKIIVKHLEINPIFKKITDVKKIQQVIVKYNLQLPFIFYCGSISPRKNILSLLKAFQAEQSQLSHQLYLLSSRQWNAQAEMNIIEADGGKRIKIIPSVTDKELVVFYSIADLFVYPSLYEGFGLPIIEAEACGCKVLCADIPTSREIGRSALTFEPNSVRDLARKIKYAVQS